MIIVSDFDGTLTIDDVTTLFWDAHLAYDWRRELLPGTYTGRVTPLEMIARGYADLAQPPETMISRTGVSKCPCRGLLLRRQPSARR